MIRCYTDFCKLHTFQERLEYLKLDSQVGQATFGHSRYLNQRFYRSIPWLSLRDRIVARDNGRDLGLEGFDLLSGDLIVIHHMNPITAKDIVEGTPFLLDPEYLICVSDRTHRAIHYGSDLPELTGPVVRVPNDTCPWKGASWKAS